MQDIPTFDEIIDMHVNLNIYSSFMISIPVVLEYLDFFRNQIKCIKQLYDKLIPKIMLNFNFNIIR